MFRLYSNENFPLPVVEELRAAGVRLVLHPLSAFRAMSKAAERVYQTLRNDGTQEALTESIRDNDPASDIGAKQAVAVATKVAADGELPVFHFSSNRP